MTAAVTALNKQIKTLAPELNSASIPSLVSVTSAVPVDAMVKVSGSIIWVFSAVARSGTTSATFTVAGMTGNATATVVGESRTLSVTHGVFTDTFAANAVHIYELDVAQATCP